MAVVHFGALLDEVSRMMRSTVSVHRRGRRELLETKLASSRTALLSARSTAHAIRSVVKAAAARPVRSTQIAPPQPPTRRRMLASAAAHASSGGAPPSSASEIWRAMFNRMMDSP